MKIHGNTKHGSARRGKKTPAYRIWESMYRRCNLPSQSSYPLYGGRGISVCERWRTFDNFVADMGEPAEGMSLDRIDSNGNYEPGNCRWVPLDAQMRNKRCNVNLTFQGETMCLAEWARKVGLKPKTLRARIYDHGLSVEAALTAPVNHTPRRKGASRHENVIVGR